MKDYLTEADKTHTACRIRQPLQLLQDFQCTLNHIMSSSKRSPSSPTPKIATARTKKQSSLIVSSKDTSQNKIKQFSTSSQSVPLKTNSQSKVSQKAKDTAVKKRSNMPVGCKNRIPQSSDLNRNHVGSLTSSPKWSHIKNKFENTENPSSKLKLGRTTSLPYEDDNLPKVKPVLKRPPSKSLSQLIPDNSLSVSRNGNVNTSKATNLKRSINLKTSGKDETKTENFQIKSDKDCPQTDAIQYTNSVLQGKEKARLSYLKSSQLNASLTPSSEVLSKNTSLRKNNVTNKPRSTFYVKETYEAKPILTFKGDKPLFRTDSINNEKTSGISDVNGTTVSRVSNICKLKQTSASNSRDNVSVKCAPSKTIRNEQEQITNLITNKLPHDKSGKTVWIKDSSGNWTKKSANGNSSNHSKVTVFHSKFNETRKESQPKNQLAKSQTTTNVPFKNTIVQAGSLAKSSTTSTICDRKRSTDHIGNKSSISEKESNVKSSNVLSRRNCENSSDKNKPISFTNKPQSKSKSADDVSPERTSKLNLVQRAVLSYEGNLSLLSPETRKRLKQLSERIKAQTDDDKILVAKNNNDILSSRNFRNYNSYSSQFSRAKTENGLQQRPNYNTSELGERIQPVRSFLTRYQQKSRIDSKDKSSDLGCSPSGENTITSNISTKFSSNSSFMCNHTDRKSNAWEQNQNKTNATDTNATLSNASEILQNIKRFPGAEKNKYEFNKEDKQPSQSAKVRCDPALMPNSSFLWRNLDTACSELSKSSTISSVSSASSDFKNYHDVENYYSSVEVEIEKRSETSDEPIYIDSQGSGESDSCYASASFHPYQNLSHHPAKTSTDDGWTDMSEDEQVRNDSPSNQNSTLKRRKNKRFSAGLKEHHKPSFENILNISHKYEKKPLLVNDTISFTDSNDTLINDEVENESTFDLNDSNHFYEPVYESLGNYLLSDDNCSISLSPDDDRSADFMQSSITSLESIENLKPDNEQNDKNKQDATSESGKTEEAKKSSNKISQLKRHLSWTKNDIRLELSSKFNKIKIKKNFQNSTEIGVKVHESDSISTSPKKKTFIKCILRQKSANSIPVKRSPSPKKESAMFYVRLSMGREKQRPISEPVVTDGGSKSKHLQNRKQSEPSLVSVSPKPVRQLPKVRKFSSGPIVQRPKTPPPLPPIKSVVKAMDPKREFCSDAKVSNGAISCAHDSYTSSQGIYAVLDPEFCSIYSASKPQSLHGDFKQNGMVENAKPSVKRAASLCSSRVPTSQQQSSNGLTLPLFAKLTHELLKSPFEEEPMYQFYHKDVQQRATLWYTADGSESEFDDDSMSKVSESESLPVKPVLQSQLSAMDLVHGDSGLRTLWCEVPEVINSGILKTVSSQERKIQEAMFEVITSEASYLKSLNFLLEHFVACPEFSGDFSERHILDKRERHILFSDIQPVRDVSASLLADLEKRWLENIVLSNICDIIYYHARRSFSVYVKYCSNQLYQERTLKELKNKRPEFVSILKRLESNPVCQSLDMHSFLMLPMQRITRLPLLIDAIFHRLSVDSPIYENCKMALVTLNKIVAECNEGARKMERMEEMLVISQQLDFKECKGFGLLSASRWLVKKGELVQLILENHGRKTFGRTTRWGKNQLYLFLFTDFLVVTRKKGEDTYSVVDYCPRNMVQVVPVDEATPALVQRLPSSYRNIFQMIMLNNKEGKTVEMLLSCLLESDRTRWMNAVTPAKSENPDEKIYEEWDCPQVQCTHAYIAQQPDELSLEETDVVNVFRKMADGWFEGERIRDGVKGWFPSSHSVEIINSHVRARNLHQRYRLLMLSQTYLEEQYKAQALQTRK